MPIPSPSAPSTESRAVPLPVLCHHEHKVKKSRMGPRRAAVLILVNLAIIAHVCFWYFGGKKPTLSPVEPSESMYTLEKGLVNAGFIFFSLALLSTLIFGRFFCGWACHVLALQDFCGWIMKKCGVHPKPFRSRLLVFGPLLLALYMFVWPTASREAAIFIKARWPDLSARIGEPAPRPVFRAALTKTDFWETFATWAVAIPFLGVCGFATVYFLGAKGFCSYGCPYGGFFAPLDTLASGRIRVTDACEHCGHCTAVCTSNVRVHEEVRDYGMVTDPGCMKCMDCISVCPNDALYFGFGAPAVLTRARTPAPKKTRFFTGSPDLSWPEEIVFFLLAIALFIAYRSMLGLVPMLMAAGMAAVVTFLAWSLYAMIRQPSLRLQSLQLKLKGSVKPAGIATIALAILMLTAAAWSGVVKFTLRSADAALTDVTPPAEVVFSPGFSPEPATRAAAETARRRLRLADEPAHGGIGWRLSTQNLSNLAYVSGVLGDYAAAERYMRRAIDSSGPRGPGPQIVRALAPAIGLQKDRAEDDVIKAYQDILAAKPHLTDARLTLAHYYALRGQADPAIEQIQRAIDDNPNDFGTLSNAAQFMINLQQLDRAADLLRRSLALEPSNTQNHVALGIVLANTGQPEQAIEQFKIAVTLDPRNPDLYSAMASIYRGLGNNADADACEQKAESLLHPAQAPKNP